MSYAVSTPTSYPYAAIVHLQVYYADGSISRGSGVVVGANDVLTASHVVHDAQLGDPVAIKVIPGRSSSDLFPYSVYTPKTLDYIPVDADGDGFLSSTDSSKDLAVLGFSEPIGDQLGWFGIDNTYTSGSTYITGYPATAPYNTKEMIEDVGNISYNATLSVLETTHALTSTANTGVSGAPVWYMDANSNPYVAGVVSAVGWATPMAGNFDTVLGWINGNDWAKLNNTITGSASDDVLYGTTDNDKLLGGSGDDYLQAYTGLDVIYGNKGNDTMLGDNGDDTLYGGQHMDDIAGGPGNDLIYGNLASDSVTGDANDDTIYGGQGDDTLIGGPGNDFLRGNRGDDYLIGGSGNDSLQGNFGTDLLFGGNGTDTAVFKGEAWEYHTVVDQVDAAIYLVHNTAATGNESTTAVDSDVEQLAFDDMTITFNRLFNGIDDFAANSNTTGTAKLNAYTSGVLDFDNDEDWFAVNFVAGNTYYIATVGQPWPSVSVHGGGGGRLAYNVDGELNYTAPANGTYYINVQDDSVDDNSPEFYQLWVS